MSQSFSAVLMNEKDNVATVLVDLEANIFVTASYGDRELEVKLLQSIPFGHKFAVDSIKKGEKIYKYGEIIGLASSDIAIGEHVHVHNLEGTRGRGDING
ncbi:UxaA family hydrolase [Bacillus timonensis]|uniref:UxaA family hydrolase n=1 Tax=Bacillus timonensis TaxID=1033734 RepID=UPI000287EAB5|nr:UxaA family hydrolase [Bacillus timonensis]